MKISKIFLSTLFLSSFIVLATTPVSAQTNSTRSTIENKVRQATNAGQVRQEIRAKINTQVCKARENIIKNRLQHMEKFVNTTFETFDKISTRTQDFYKNTVVPTGKTVPNYDTLVTTIQTKKTAAQTALTAMQTDMNGFSCDATDPKGVLLRLQTYMKTIKTALQEYRTSIKNLITAVHGVATQGRFLPSGTPKVTFIP